MFRVRPCRDRDELARAYYAIGQYFGAPPKEERLEQLLRILPLERMLAAFDGDEIVGGAASFSFSLSVPGGSLPCAGISIVGVYPTHRRRGALRAMMRAQLDDVHERGEPLAALWASEETIYGRFGYGVASFGGEVTVPQEWTAFAQPLERRGRVRFVEAGEAAELFPPVYEELARQRPGMPSRSRAWWETRTLHVREENVASTRFVVLELDGRAEGYAIFRREMAWAGNVSTAKLEVQEALGATPRATAELWRFLLDIDWTATFVAPRLPPDHPLLLLLANPRRARFRLDDALWVRLVDVGAALSGRAYAGEGAIVLELRDELCPWNEGRWRVAAGAGAERTAEPAELALDAAALGAAYLGGVSFSQLRDALRVQELAEGAVERADRLFAWRPLPWCPEIF